MYLRVCLTVQVIVGGTAPWSRLQGKGALMFRGIVVIGRGPRGRAGGGQRQLRAPRRRGHVQPALHAGRQDTYLRHAYLT